MPRLRTDKQLGLSVLEPENQMRDVEFPEQALIGECCVESNEKGDNMDDALKAKLDEARKRMNNQQAGINENRKHDDPAMREWARGKQRPANAQRAEFRASLTDEERRRIEERIEQLVRDNPALSPTNARTLNSKREPPSVPSRSA